MEKIELGLASTILLLMVGFETQGVNTIKSQGCVYEILKE